MGRRGGRAVREGPGVASLGAGGVLLSLYQASVLKGTIGAGGVFLGASGRGVSEAVAVAGLGVATILRHFRDLDSR